MANFNQVTLCGNLTKDVELRHTGSGMAVCDIGLAVNDRRKGTNGEWVEETLFIDVTLWGRTAEIADEYIKQGSNVLITGKLKMDTWDDKGTGAKRTKIKITATNMQMLGERGSVGGEVASKKPENSFGLPTAVSQSVPEAENPF